MAYSDVQRGRWSQPGLEYVLTFVTAGRRPVFDEFGHARMFVAELAAVERDELGSWLAWVLMPDHFHGLFSLSEGLPLSHVVKRLKARSARRINLFRRQYGPLWQRGFHEHALRREEDRLAAARYIVANPLRAGLVRRVGDYPHCDCRYL